MEKETFKVTDCEVCGNNILPTVLDLGSHPMCDDLVPVNDTRVAPEYPIEIVFCKNCLTAHQKFQVPKRELFPNTYHYRSRFTNDVLNGMKNLVQRTEEIYGNLKSKKILDIGCNDGSLLDFFKEKGCVTYGIEPTDAVKEALDKGHQAYQNYFDEEIAQRFIKEHGAPDFITFTNVFAHIEDLKAVIRALKLLSGEDTILVIENHYLGAVLNKYQFDTFYHEHPRTYSHSSFLYIAKALNRDLLHVEFPSRYGGNIRVFIGSSKSISGLLEYNPSKIAIEEETFVKKFELINSAINRWKASKGEFLNTYVKKHGKIKAKAFPGRAAILIKLLNIDENIISAAYEKPGSNKIGHYVAGTRIPIISDDVLFNQTDINEPILNLAWHIESEIKSYLSNSGYKGEVYDILNVTDFE